MSVTTCAMNGGRVWEAFRQAFPDLKMISLTATPPYEGDPTLWERYIRMCGEIDEEITVPELVKEETLCPHQDYVYFAFPTKEEQEQLDAFSQQKNALLQQLTSRSPLLPIPPKTARPYRVRSAMMNCSIDPSISLLP